MIPAIVTLARLVPGQLSLRPHWYFASSILNKYTFRLNDSLFVCRASVRWMRQPTNSISQSLSLFLLPFHRLCPFTGNVVYSRKRSRKGASVGSRSATARDLRGATLVVQELTRQTVQKLGWRRVQSFWLRIQWMPVQWRGNPGPFAVALRYHGWAKYLGHDRERERELELNCIRLTWAVGDTRKNLRTRK